MRNVLSNGSSLVELIAIYGYFKSYKLNVLKIIFTVYHVATFLEICNKLYS